MNEQNNVNNKSIFLIIAVVLILSIAIFVILNLKNSKEENNQKPTNQNIEELNNAIQVEGSSEVVNPVVEKAVQVAAGASLISEEGEVINNQGEKVELSAAPMTENAPRPSVAISKEDIPQDSIIINLSADAFSPESFTVSAGKSVSLAFTNNDKVAHTMLSRDKNLRALMVTVAAGENKVFVFNAPEQAGTYEIRSAHPRYTKNVIKMIVK
jgi:plastocyanin